MTKLDRLQTFVTVVDKGSFALAADALGIGKAQVAAQIAALETELGRRLLVPETSPLAVTDSGYRFYESCAHVVSTADAAMEDARAEDASLTGILRVTSTAEYGVEFLVPALTELGRLHPKLKLQLTTSAVMDDLSRARTDVAIYTGRLRTSMARDALLGRFRVVAVASPEYLRDAPRVTKPYELRQYQWIAHASVDAPYTWVSSGSHHKVALEAMVQADNAMAVLAFARAGRGVAILPEWIVSGAIADGSVVEVLPEFRLTDHGVFAVYPDPDHIPGKVRELVALLRRKR
ncbi:MAG: LysR family transcriptional regulator [Polyangia bacterium]